MKEPRRLDLRPKDTYQRLQRGVLRHVEITEEAFRELERERPELIAVEEEAVLAGAPGSAATDLQYTFANRDVFTARFPEMLARLLPAISAQEWPLGIRFRLTSRSDRAFVEPVLFANAFELMREWLRLALHDLPDETPGDEIAPGFVVRPATLDDAEAIAELDAIVFAASFLTPQAVRGGLTREQHTVRLLEETASGRTAGFLRLRSDAAGEGYVSDIAVHPSYQGRGLGEGLMRWAFGWFRARGMRRAALTVNTENTGAIALYRRLGFVQDEVGLDYRRPADEEEARQILERRRTVHITVNRRFGRR